MAVTEESDHSGHPRVSEKLREARTRAGLTQAEVAERSGLSLSFIRLVESGRSDISLSRLLKWTTIFGLPVADLFSEEEPTDVTIVHSDERVEVPSRESGVRFFLLSSGGDHDLEPAIFELARGAQMHRELRHDGEETAFVLHGNVRLSVAGGDYLLETGDNAYYRSNLPHRFANAGEGPAALLVTTTHPTLHPRTDDVRRKVRLRPAAEARSRRQLG